MEHRCSIRKQIAIRVLFYKHGLPVQSGQSRDLGLGGVFIETDPYRWHKNECIDVEFISTCGAKLRLPALVVHQRKQGVGLMFDAVEAEQRKVLRDILFNTKLTDAFRIPQIQVNNSCQVA
ncbi:MAG: PilZ domain-containing protein [Gammaproteobacteria bacterium]